MFIARALFKGSDSFSLQHRVRGRGDIFQGYIKLPRCRPVLLPRAVGAEPSEPWHTLEEALHVWFGHSV